MFRKNKNLNGKDDQPEVVIEKGMSSDEKVVFEQVAQELTDLKKKVKNTFKMSEVNGLNARLDDIEIRLNKLEQKGN